MDFVIKVGVDGHQFLLTLQNENKKLQVLQEMIQSETKIEIKNQLLLTKKGSKLEDLQQFEVDSQMQQTIQQLQDDQKFYTIYLFDLNENPETIQYPMPKYEPKMELKALVLTEQAKETLLNLNSNILNQEKMFFQHLQNLKNKYIPYQQKVKHLEKIGQDLENQIQSFDIVLKMSRATYKNTKQRREDLTKKQKESLERNMLTVKKFDDSLEQLKKVELHVALQTNTQKYLSDIYYKPESMQKWKNSCINTQQALKQKIDKLNVAISKSKQKIKNEKTENMTQCLSSYKMNQQQYQQFIQESKSLLQSVVQSTVDEYNQLRQYMIDFSQDINDEPAMYYLSQFELTQEQMKQFDEAIIHLGEHLEKTKQVFLQFQQLKQQNTQKIQKVFLNLRNLNKEFEQHNEKLKQYEDEVEKMEKDFSYLLNPVLLPQAYQQALIETSRRREFRDIFDKKIKSLMYLVDQEKEKRKKFLQQHGRILPQDFFGQLKNLTPSIQIINPFADAELPNITGMHTDQFKKRNDNDTYIEQLKQQIDDLNQQCKQTHLYYQEKTIKKSSTYQDLLQLTAKNALKLFINRAENKPLCDEQQKSQKENDSRITGMKNEMNEQVTQVKSDNDKLKLKLQKLEQDFESKLVEIDTKNNQLQELQQKLDSSQLNCIKIKEDLNKFVGKCENFEITLIQKNNEISKLQSLQKQLNDQLNQTKLQYQDLLKSRQSSQQQLEQQYGDQLNEMELLNKQYLQQVQEYYSQIQTLQNELEKVKQKVKSLEIERENKQIELEKQISSYNELLEEFVEKNNYIEEMTDNQQQNGQQIQKYIDEQKSLQNKIDNLEIAIQQKNNEIIVLKNSDQLQMLSQQEDFKQVQEQYENKINYLTQEKLDLTIQIQSLQGQIDYLNQKQKTENVIEVHQKLKLSDPQFMFDLSSVNIGKQSIFIPAQNGVYVPLILKNIQISNIQDDSLTNTSIETQQLKQYKVQLQSISQNYREFIIDTGLLFISEVSNIIETEDAIQVTVKQPNYIIGFEDQDNQIKNFTL